MVILKRKNMETLERYTVLGALGRGSYGEVLKCRCRRSGELFAVKKFYYKDRSTLRKSMEREVKPLSRFSHDNVVKVLRSFKKGGQLYAVFELLNHTIQDELKENFNLGLDKLTVKKYSFQIFSGLAYLHSNNVIHRDVKPDNILVSASGVVKLADLGSGRKMGPRLKMGLAADLTINVGTPVYNAPELLLWDPKYNTAVDVWAVGCTLLTMARGRTFVSLRPYLYLTPEHDLLPQIISKLGPLTQHQQNLYSIRWKDDKINSKKTQFPTNLSLKYGLRDVLLAKLVEACLQMEPDDRLSCSQMLCHQYFTEDNFHESFTKGTGTGAEGLTTGTGAEGLTTGTGAEGLQHEEPEPKVMPGLLAADPATRNEEEVSEVKKNRKGIKSAIRRSFRTLWHLFICTFRAEE